MSPPEDAQLREQILKVGKVLSEKRLSLDSIRTDASQKAEVARLTAEVQSLSQEMRTLVNKLTGKAK